LWVEADIKQPKTTAESVEMTQSCLLNIVYLRQKMFVP
jgi:hypothetical protein